MTSPPRPPSPPSGPPIGTNFSRRNELAPEPPVPASTRTMTRSMNMLTRRSPSSPDYSCEQLVIALRIVGTEEVGDGIDARANFGGRRSGVQRTVQMRVQLPVLSRQGACAHDAQLPSLQIERGSREHLAVAVYDHPCVERRVELPDVVSEPFIERTVHRSTRGFAGLAPL